MKKILIVVLMLLLIPVGFIQAQSVYQNDEGHFALIVPNEWGQATQEAVNSMNNNASQLSGKRVNNVAIFQRTTGETHPLITVSIFKNGRMAEGELQTFLNDKSQQNAFQKEVGKYSKNIPKDKLKEMVWGKFSYDKERKMLLMKSKGVTGNQTVLVMTAEALSNYGYVALNIFSDEQHFDNNLDDFNQVLNSFKFDEGYRY